MRKICSFFIFYPDAGTFILLLQEGPAKFTGHDDEEVPSTVLVVPIKGHHLSI